VDDFQKANSWKPLRRTIHCSSGINNVLTSVIARPSDNVDRDPRNGRLHMSEPRVLVEHFFRHEFGRLVAVLTRSLGVRRLDLVEDVVQAALVQALEIWSRCGVPPDPAGWLYRTARNLAIDALRRERTHAQALPRPAEDAERPYSGVPLGIVPRGGSPLEAHFADEIGDEPLRLLFVCCHAGAECQPPFPVKGSQGPAARTFFGRPGKCVVASSANRFTVSWTHFSGPNGSLRREGDRNSTAQLQPRPSLGRTN
jgi:hypothetical protein